jgi:hypothetical protein
MVILYYIAYERRFILMEIWKDIIGIENYQVSNEGRVKRLKHRKKIGTSSIPSYKTYNERLLNPSPNKHGYINVWILDKSHYVHTLVAKAFIPNPENKPEINHKDLDKSNNHVSNLEWVTRSENMRHSYNTRN